MIADTTNTAPIYGPVKGAEYYAKWNALRLTERRRYAKLLALAEREERAPMAQAKIATACARLGWQVAAVELAAHESTF